MLFDDPHLFEGELEVMRAAMAASRRYQEFGLGGSSLLAVRSGIETIVALDSDPKWVGSVRAHAEIAPRIADGSMSVLHADIGPIREWGNPLDRSHLHKWPNYFGTAWAEWARRESFPDLVFVDGRFRVSCCLSVVVAFGGRTDQPPPLTMLHDYNDERPHYRDVLAFFDLERLENSLALLRIRTDASPLAAFAQLTHRQFDFG